MESGCITITISLTAPPLVYYTSSNTKYLFYKYRNFSGPHSGSVAEMGLGPRYPVFILWPPQFSTTSFPRLIYCFHKPEVSSSWWHFKKTRQYSAESLPSIKRNQDFDVLQLEQRRCVENTKQMFGLGIQNNMYLTLQFKKAKFKHVSCWFSRKYRIL